jgi:hypothetical protein
MPTDKGGLGEPVSRVGRLRCCRRHADELIVAAKSDDVDEVTGFEGREPNLDAADRARLDGDHPRLPGGALVYKQRAAGSLHNDACHPADVGPDPVGHMTA